LISNWQNICGKCAVNCRMPCLPRNPSLSRSNVRALYHEAKHRKIPMTRLADELVAKRLAGSVGWQKAQEIREGIPPYQTK